MKPSMTVYLLLERITYPLQARDRKDELLPLPPVLAEDAELLTLCRALSALYDTCYLCGGYRRDAEILASDELYRLASLICDRVEALQDGSFVFREMVLRRLVNFRTMRR